MTETTVVVFVDGDERRWLATVQDLARPQARDVVVAAGDEATLASFAELPVDTLVAADAREAIDTVWSKRRTHIFAVTDAALAPDDAIERAEQILAGDLRHATVSFFSNDAGPLSFPTNHPTPAAPPGFDHASLTRRLRALEPHDAPYPAPYAAGAAVMLSDVALAAVGGLEAPPPGVAIEACLADFSLRCRERGFVDLLDPETFVFRPPTPGTTFRSSWFTAGDRDWLIRRHPQLLPAFEAEVGSRETPLALATRSARVKTFGLRVLVDDATLGPFETGAQITTLAIIDALAKLDEVQVVGVALGNHIPAYAQNVLGQPKIDVNLRVGGYAAFADYDVLHRTAQPDKDFDVDAARGPAARVVISILDLIAYHAASYHATADEWLQYRGVLREATRRADGITTISEDVAATLQRERLPVEHDRVFPVLYGTEHLSGHEPAAFPQELADDGRLGGEFMVCVGTDYAHKNRDLAIKAWQELRRRGHQLELIMAGVVVPVGSTRNEEVLAAAHGPQPIVLPDVSDSERNWLLRHATVVLYPTSAEGFGLVPFEAAEFDTPTVFVSFGPLAEFLDGVPVAARDWTANALADAVAAVVRDPGVASAQVAAVKKVAAGLTWDAVAEQLVRTYLDALSRPSGRPG